MRDATWDKVTYSEPMDVCTNRSPSLYSLRVSINCLTDVAVGDCGDSDS